MVIIIQNNTTMNKLKKEDFVRLRLNEVERQRVDALIELTCRKQSDLYREAMFDYISTKYPQFLKIGV